MKRTTLSTSRWTGMAFCLLTGTLVAQVAAASEIFLCDVGNLSTESSVLVFRKDGRDGRHVEFADSDRVLAIRTPRGKGIVAWENVAQVNAVPISPNGRASHFSVTYRRKSGQTQTIDFGTIDATCLGRLRERYEPHLRFETVRPTK